MARYTISSVWAHGSDANIRTWGQEFHDMLAAVGMVQTTDTGQVDWTTVTYPGINQDYGYEVWRFADTLQATAPIFLKFIFGTYSAATRPYIKLQVGTGSDGAGNLTDSQELYTAYTGTGNETTTYSSYACHVEGFFGLSWKAGAVRQHGFFISRTFDSTGAPTADGALCLYTYTSTMAHIARCVRFSGTLEWAQANANPTVTMLSIAPQSPSTTLVGGTDNEAFLCFMKPLGLRTSVCVPLLAVYAGELGQGSTFSLAPIGAASRDYIVASGGATALLWTSPTPGLAMLWEV